ncbi:MAG TPA: hypothetical protein VFT76_00070 [Actinomycetota bacterium]|nr:hypothetical protein [Actinomycetota bacterium]
MTWDELQEATGYAPPADEFHDDLRAPKHEEAREEIAGTFPTTGREGGYERSGR